MTVHIDKKSAVPWWAAFGAPLLGVPLMVAALALCTPSEPQEHGSDETSVFVADEVDAEMVDHLVEIVLESGVDVDARS